MTSKVRSVRPSGSVETVPVSQSVSSFVGIEAVAGVVDLADRDHRAMGVAMLRTRCGGRLGSRGRNGPTGRPPCRRARPPAAARPPQSRPRRLIFSRNHESDVGHSRSNLQMRMICIMKQMRGSCNGSRAEEAPENASDKGSIAVDSATGPCLQVSECSVKWRTLRSARHL